MGFKKFTQAEGIKTVERQTAEAIRGIVKRAGVKSAADLTDAERSQLPKS